MMKEEAKEMPNYITWDDHRRSINRLDEEIRSLRKQIKFLVAVLVDKKLIGEQTAKAFSETCPEKVLKWFLEKNKPEE